MVDQDELRQRKDAEGISLPDAIGAHGVDPQVAHRRSAEAEPVVPGHRQQQLVEAGDRLPPVDRLCQRSLGVLVMGVLAFGAAGNTWGFGRQWARTALARRSPILR